MTDGKGGMGRGRYGAGWRLGEGSKGQFRGSGERSRSAREQALVAGVSRERERGSSGRVKWRVPKSEGGGVPRVHGNKKWWQKGQKGGGGESLRGARATVSTPPTATDP
jgi:hypothetical protein